MNSVLRVLIVEDSKMDINLIVYELEKELGAIVYDTVSNKKDFLSLLAANDYDVILSDYSLPQWDAEKAFKTLQMTKKNIPFIVVSGTIGEERVVVLMKMGIRELVLKDKLFRLPEVIRRVLKEDEMDLKHKQMHKKLQLSESVFKGVLEQSGLAVFSYDLMGNILFWNRRSNEIFGVEAEKAVRKNLTGLFPGTAGGLMWEKVEKVFKGEAVEAYDWAKNVHEGKRYFHTAHYGIKDEDGKVALGVCITFEVTEREQLQAQLIQAQKMEAIGQLAGGIAHDFNNQMTIIVGNLKLALQNPALNMEIREALLEAEKATEQCVLTVKGLLMIGRKSPDAERKTVDLHALIDEFEKLIRHVLPATIQIEIRKMAGRSCMNANPTQLHQILMNLAVNARDAMRSGGNLIIETNNVYFEEGYARKIPGAKPGQFVCISVTDSGSGIDPENMDKIFEPFFTTKSETEGTGLGLSTVYGIMKSHGGWISVYSEPGHGTTFKLYFPVSFGTAENSIKPEQSQSASGHEMILVADDELAIRNLTRIVLEQKGYNVLLAENREEMLSIYRRRWQEIDIVLMDLTMPKMPADEAISRLKDIYENALVIISSGYSLSGPEGDYLKSRGAIGFIQKPYPPDDLLKIVRDTIDTKTKIGAEKRNAA